MASATTVNQPTEGKQVLELENRTMAANIQQSADGLQNQMYAKAGASTVMKRILLVDNQAHVLRVMKSTLDRNGYEVDTALSCDVALGMLRVQKYDALIADSRLEKLDGQQLINTIRDQYKSRAPAMFLVTDNDSSELDQWCDVIERTECLQKPISLRYLVGRLNELFGKYDDL